MAETKATITEQGDITGKLLQGTVMLVMVMGVLTGMTSLFNTRVSAESPGGDNSGGTLPPGAGYGLIHFRGTPGVNILIDGSIPIGQIPLDVEISDGAHGWTAYIDPVGNTQSRSFLSVAGEEQTITINF